MDGDKKLPQVKKQVSSGGVIFRRSEKKLEVVLIKVKGGRWALPKGMVDKGEAPEETALREVREETGLKGELIDKLGDIEYWYFSKEDRAKYHKYVHFYLLEYSSGSVNDHDWEVEEAKWFPIEEAITTLSYKSEKDIVQKAAWYLTKKD